MNRTSPPGSARACTRKCRCRHSRTSSRVRSSPRSRGSRCVRRRCGAPEIRMRPHRGTGLGARVARPKRARVTDLQAKRNAELDALGIDRIVTTIVGWEAPEPRQLANTDETELRHATPELAHGIHRAMQIHRADSDEAFGCALTVRATSSFDRSGPGPHQADVSALPTPAASSAASVSSIGISSGITSSFIQRRREANMSWPMNCAVGC